jgi:DNA polymerase III sliding clamp (beta) subunit (PCNA family)
MQVSVHSADRLGKALASANAAITSKDNNPLLNSMLLDASGEELTIVVVDNTSHQLKLTVPATVAIPGSVLIPGDYFTKIVNRLGDHPATIKLIKNQLQVETGLSDVHKFDLTQGEPEDFPIDYEMPPIVGVVDGDGLHEALKAILFSATETDQDLIFHGQDGTFTMYTSHWLQCRSRFQMVSLDVPFTFAVPKSVLAGGRLPQWSGHVNVHVGPDKIAFSFNNEHLIIKRLVPPEDVGILEGLIGTAPIGSLVVGLQLLKNRVHTIAIGKQVCIMSVTGKTDKNLSVKAENAGSGASAMHVTVQGKILGTTPPVKLDVALVEKALKTIDGDDCKVDFIDYVGDMSAIAIRISNEANPEKRQTLITPVGD